MITYQHVYLHTTRGVSPLMMKTTPPTMMMTTMTSTSSPLGAVRVMTNWTNHDGLPPSDLVSRLPGEGTSNEPLLLRRNPARLDPHHSTHLHNLVHGLLIY